MTLRATLLGVLALFLAAPTSATEGEPAPDERRAAIARQLQELRDREPRSARRLGQEARLLHFLAEATPDDAERRRARGEGLRVAEQALALDRDEPGAILWWTAHRGSQATPHDPVAAVRIASEVEEALLRLRSIDPGFEYSAADRVLGVVYQVAPPVISVGSVKKAEKHLRDAMARHPWYPGNQLVWAELLARSGNCRLARAGAELVLGSRDLARFALEAPGWTRQANALLERCP